MNRPGAGAASESLGSDALLAREERRGGRRNAESDNNNTLDILCGQRLALCGECRDED